MSFSDSLDHAPTLPAPLTYIEVCAKCRGSGRYTGRSQWGPQCFACKGAGKFERRTSPEARAKAKASAGARKVKAAASIAEHAAAWRAENPAQAAWLAEASARGFDFAQSMTNALNQWGHLTERQAAAVERMAAEAAERSAGWAAERKAREAAAPAVDIAKIEQAFAAALAKGKASPKLRLAGFRFAPAPKTSTNAGAIYVKRAEDGEYLGKIAGGRFHNSRVCEAVEAAEVVAVAGDPKGAAVAYGRAFGQCSCCGKELTNAASIALGIGPVCASRFGW